MEDDLIKDDDKTNELDDEQQALMDVSLYDLMYEIKMNKSRK